MPPLPRDSDPLVQSLKDSPKSAYINCILLAEDDADRATDRRRSMHIRILGGLLIYAPTPTACECVAREILNAMRDLDLDRRGALDKLNRLGQLYFDHFIRIFKKYKGRTPMSSGYWSRSAYERNSIIRELIQTPQNHSSAKQNALIRDGFRCMLTGRIEHSVWTSNISAFPDPNEMLTTTNCCHIMPEAKNNFNAVKDPDLKIEWASGVWTILEHFGYSNIRKELEGTAAHWLGNILTLELNVHNLLDTLDLWLEAVPGQEHTYDVRTYPPELRAGFRLPERVHFTVHDMDVPGFPRPSVEHLPLPSPRYLKIHAACCKVAHVSGAAEYLDEVVRDMESIDVLAEDGGSADVLIQAIVNRLVAPNFS